MAHTHLKLGTYGYKHTLSEYVILIVFPLQQCLHECASVLRYSTLPATSQVRVIVVQLDDGISFLPICHFTCYHIITVIFSIID